MGQRPIFADDATAFRSLSAPNFAPGQAVFLPPEAKSSITVGDRTEGKVVAARLEAHRAQIETVASQPSLVVIAQSYYHPWRARVDGRLTQLWRANYAYQALQVPAGTSKVILTYQDGSFYFGVVLSLGTLIGCAAAWFRAKEHLSGPRDRR